MTHFPDQDRGKSSPWRCWAICGRAVSGRIVTHLRSMITCRECREIINRAHDVMIQVNAPLLETAESQQRKLPAHGSWKPNADEQAGDWGNGTIEYEDVSR